MELTPTEKEVAARIGFDEAVLLMVKPIASGDLEQMVDEDRKPVPVLAAALPAKLSESASATLAEQVDGLRSTLRTRGYCVYRTRRGGNYYTFEERQAGKPFREPLVALLRSSDQFDILRVENTSAGNYDLDNGAVIATLREWERRHGLEIIAADYDTVELRLKKAPEDALAFARAVYDCCPDIIDQGAATSFDEECGFGLEYLAQQGYDVSRMTPDIDPTEGGIQILAQDIRKHRRVFLWWD